MMTGYLTMRRGVIALVALCVFHSIVNQHVECFATDEGNNSNVKVNRFRRASGLTQCNYSYVPYSNSCDICGNVSYSQNARIVGGVQATAYSWPAQVYITNRVTGRYTVGWYSYTSTSTFVCGGTLINRYTILTAAHCINTEFTTSSGYTAVVDNPYDASQFTVYVGAYDVSFMSYGSSPTYPTVKMSVRKVIRHPSYNSNNFLNDAALLLLSNPADLNAYVQPACLPNPTYGSYPPTSTTVYAAGWGTLSEGGSSPTKLYNVALTAYASTSCSNVETTYTKNWNSQLCAGLSTGGKDTCQGDSGGGLYAYDSTLRKYVVVGITSYGEGCGRFNKPGVYTRTSYYYDWITTNWATTGNAGKLILNPGLLFSLVFVVAFKSN